MYNICHKACANTVYMYIACAMTAHSRTTGFTVVTGDAGLTGEPGTSPRRRLGLIAQEVQQVFPELVHAVSSSSDEDGAQEPLLGVDYAALVPALLEALKQLDAQVAVLAPGGVSRRMDALMQRVSALENDYRALSAALQQRAFST